MRATTSAASTRPWAAASGTVSAGSGEKAAVMRATASATGIMAQGARNSPDRPPALWVSRTSVMRMPRSAALHMS